MEKLCLLLAFNVLWIVPSPTVPLDGGPPDVQQVLPYPVDPQEKGGLRVDGVVQWTTVEINGVLDYDDGGVHPRIPEFGVWIGYSITSGGKWFGLDFGANKQLEEQAKKLNGKRVVIRGKLEDRDLDGFIKQRIKVVVVSELEAVSEQPSITVRLTGLFQASATITYLYDAPVITVNGKQYVIDYEGAEGIFAAARKFNGKRVVLTGTLTGTQSLPQMCILDGITLPVVFLTGVEAADEKAKDSAMLTVKSKLEKRKRLLPRDCDQAATSGWAISANGRRYELDFRGDKKHMELAEKLNGQTVVVTGSLEVEARRINSADTFAFGCGVVDPILMIDVEVFRVTEFQTVALDSVRETVHLDVQGELKSLIRMGIPPARDWMIKAGDQSFHLQFSSDLPKEKPATLDGQKVIVTGTRMDDGTMLVTGLRTAGDR